MTATVYNPAQQLEALKGKESIDLLSAQQKQQQADALVIAIYYLMQASATTNDTALLHAKQLNQNAASQQKLNQQENALNLESVPKEILNHHSTIIVNKHWTLDFWKHGFFEYTTAQIKTWNTSPNAGIVNNKQAMNQDISAQRQMLADRLNVLQQNAQVGEANVNDDSNEAMQTFSEVSGMVQMLQALTFLALFRRQPQQ